MICFYATGIGVLAHGEVGTSPEKRVHSAVRYPEKYPYTFRLTQTKLYIESPVVVDETLRARLDAFANRNVGGNWSWFVQATRRITAADYLVLTGQAPA